MAFCIRRPIVAGKSGRGLDTLRSQIEGPGQHEGERKTHEHDRNHQPLPPVGQVEEWENGDRDLDDEPTDHGIAHRHAVNLASF